jgi:hypothetical protein
LCKTPELIYSGEDAQANGWGFYEDHVLLWVQWRRHLHMINITGTDRTHFALYKGEEGPKSMPSYITHVSHDDTWYYAQIRVALRGLWALGCEIVGDPVIKCVFWAHAREEFTLGPRTFNQSIAVRFPVDITVPGEVGEVETLFWVWPTPLYDARIIYFVMNKPPSYSAKMTFLVMVPNPYQTQGMVLSHKPPNVKPIVYASTGCETFGTMDKCFEQFRVDLSEEEGEPYPCTAGGLRSYTGTYTIQGGTECQSGFAGCTNPPGSLGAWRFDFAVKTAEFCDYYLEYNTAKDIVGVLASYDDSAYTIPRDQFNAGETVYFTAFPRWTIAVPTFHIKSTSLVSISVNVLGNRYDNIENEFGHVTLLTAPVLDPPEQRFSVWMEAANSPVWLAPLLIPGPYVEYTFGVVLDVFYEFNGKEGKLQVVKEFELKPVHDSYVGVPQTVSTGAAVASVSNAGVAVGASLGAVAIAAAVGAVWYFRTHRRGYTSTV